MNVHDLPDLCMVNIFCRVPLRDLIRAGQVCTRWRWIQSIVTGKLRSITILVGKDAFSLIESSRFEYHSSFSEHILNDDGTPMFKHKILSVWSSVQLNPLDTENVFALAKMFSYIHTLTIALNTIGQHNQLLMVAILLRLFVDKLVNLRIFCSSDHAHIRMISPDISRQLFNTINLMFSLKHLTLEFIYNFALSEDLLRAQHPRALLTLDDLETRTIDLSIISKLDEFNFYSIDDERGDVMFDSLQRYGQHCQRPLRIQYGYSGLNKHIPKLAQFKRQFCRRFTRFLSMDDYVGIPSDEIISFCARFTCVTEVWFEVKNITIILRTSRNLMNSLAQLAQLVHLRLVLWFNRILPAESGNIFPLMPSVKSIDLNMTTTNHDNLSLLNIARTFPNVQAIGLNLFNDLRCRCDICGYDEREHNFPQNPENILRGCFQQVLIPLRQSAQLHTITKFKSMMFVVDKQPLTKEDIMQTIEFGYVFSNGY